VVKLNFYVIILTYILRSVLLQVSIAMSEPAVETRQTAMSAVPVAMFMNLRKGDSKHQVSQEHLLLNCRLLGAVQSVVLKLPSSKYPWVKLDLQESWIWSRC